MSRHLQMSKKALIIKCLRERSCLFDSTVGNIKWCQNELRTQDNSLLLLLTIGKGNDWNIIKYHGDITENFQWWKVKMTLEATWLASRHYG